MYPDDRKYSKEHEWIRIDGDKGTVGITDYAQTQLGDVVYVELPEVGTKLSAADVFGNIESVKAVSELFCPVAGEVLETNSEVVETPELVNKDPHEKAWLMIIRVADPSELDDLLSASAYEKYVEEEAKS
ncbi:MAG: glycine cleavage system protein GcvH [Acidobacteriota bacterium]